MNYPAPLITARLIQRYKRFLADVRLEDGTEITVHCPNTGSMKACAEPGSRVWLSDSQAINPTQASKRKYRFTWEWVEVQKKYKACINTQRPNQLIEEALQMGVLQELAEGRNIVREPKVEDGRLDFCLSNDRDSLWIEVKSVTLLEQENGLGCFPDAVTSRGLKHLQRLQAIVASGDQAMLIFCVPHEGIAQVTSAEHIDPNYAEGLRQAVQQGVSVKAYSVQFCEKSSHMRVIKEIPVLV